MRVLKLVIEDDEGRRTVVPFSRDEITIGREEGNTVRLTERNVSRRHARLLRQDGTILLEDLGSYNGCKLNGEKVRGMTPIRQGDLIQIGDYDLAVTEESAEAGLPETSTEASNGANGAHPAIPAGEGSADDIARNQPTAVIRRDGPELQRPREVASIDPSHAPRLVVLNTHYAGREFSCIRSELSIGRTDDNDITLDHRSLSRNHAKLWCAPGGEWRLEDSGSANGLMVNGESYTQVPLKSRDTIELGHVKLRFLAAGDNDGPFAKLSRAGRGPSRWAVGLGLLVLMSVAGASATLYFRHTARGSSEMSSDEARASEEELAIARAKDAIAAKNLPKAVTLLAGLSPSKAVAPEVENLLGQARQEAAHQEAISQAQKSLSQGALEVAAEQLSAAGETRLFASELQDLKRRLAAASAATEGATPAAATAPSGSPQTDEAKRHSDLAAASLMKNHLKEAEVSLRRCIELDPSNARCHKLLGTTYAKLRDPERGASHYRKFLLLAPEDPQAHAVRKIVDSYERKRRE